MDNKYKNIVFHKRVNKWSLSRYINGSKWHLGYFNSIDEAIKHREEVELKFKLSKFKRSKKYKQLFRIYGETIFEIDLKQYILFMDVKPYILFNRIKKMKTELEILEEEFQNLINNI